MEECDKLSSFPMFPKRISGTYFVNILIAKFLLLLYCTGSKTALAVVPAPKVKILVLRNNRHPERWQSPGNGMAKTPG